VDRLSLYVNVAARFAQRAASLEDAVGVVVFAAQPLAMLAPARGRGRLPRLTTEAGGRSASGVGKCP
jgi:hypothetical protein